MTATVHTLVSPAEIAHLREIRDEALAAMDRVAEHERKGWPRIALGAFDRLRGVLDVEVNR